MGEELSKALGQRFYELNILGSKIPIADTVIIMWIIHICTERMKADA